MQPIEIIVIIAAVGIVGSVIGNYIYKKVKHLPTGECACCKQKMEKNLKQIKKQLAKEKNI